MELKGGVDCLCQCQKPSEGHRVTQELVFPSELALVTRIELYFLPVEVKAADDSNECYEELPGLVLGCCCQY